MHCPGSGCGMLTASAVWKAELSTPFPGVSTRPIMFPRGGPQSALTSAVTSWFPRARDAQVTRELNRAGAWAFTSHREVGGGRHALHRSLHHAHVLPAVLQLDVSDHQIARCALWDTRAVNTLLVGTLGVPATPPSGGTGREDRWREADRGHSRVCGVRDKAAPPAATTSKTNGGRDHGLSVQPPPRGGTNFHSHRSAPHCPPVPTPRNGLLRRRGSTRPPRVPGAEAGWRSEGPTRLHAFLEGSGTVDPNPLVSRN